MIPNQGAPKLSGWADEIHRVSTAFDRWQAARRKLQALTRDFKESLSPGIFPPDQPVTPEQLIHWNRLVVGGYHEIFQAVVLASQARVKRESRQARFQVRAKWDIADQSPTPPEEDGNIYEVMVLFDMPNEIPGVGARLCLMLGWVNDRRFKLQPVPVDNVDQVEFCVILPPRTES